MSNDKLQEALDTLDIQALKAIYLEICDFSAKDPSLVATGLKQVCTEDVTADYGMGPIANREALIVFMTEIANKSESAWHAISTPRIEIAGDTAVARWTVSARRKRKGASEAVTVVGRYRDDLRRTPQGWRFTAIRLTLEA